MASRDHPGINQQTGRLKRGYHYDKGGRIVKASKPSRSKHYDCAKKLGKLGGKASAKKQRRLF